jgi:hypothetical protein
MERFPKDRMRRKRIRHRGCIYCGNLFVEIEHGLRCHRKCRVPEGGESPGKARMHTCLDQYKANKSADGNGGLKWIAKGDGYYSECNKRLKGVIT